jgi:uncharacterized membrane protein YedE/YeeE
MSFTPWMSLAGGALIGTSASLLLAVDGRVAGISGIVGGLLKPARGEVSWRAFFLGGLLAGGLLLEAVRPSSFGVTGAAPAMVVAAGLLVGFGTRLGSGCTSGHGVCGNSRLSLRSLVATAIFLGVGMMTASFVLHRVAGIGGAP